LAGGDGGFGGGAGGGPPPSDGSAVLRQGGTLVLASVSGPCSRPGAADGAPAALEVELSLAAFATPERRPRRRGDRRVAEVEAAARAAFETVLELKLYPRAVITLRVAVLQADGGLLAGAWRRRRAAAGACAIALVQHPPSSSPPAAVINAGVLALLDAGLAMRDYVVGCAVVAAPGGAGGGRGAILLDPCHSESMSGGAEMTVALLPRSGKVTVCTMDARLPLERFQGLLAAAADGAQQIFAALEASALEHAADSLARRDAARFGAGGAGAGGARAEAAGDEDDYGGGGGGDGEEAAAGAAAAAAAGEDYEDE
jgi:exosome complex component RRP41